MQFARLMAQNWRNAAGAMVKRGLLGLLSGVLFLAALGFGVAGAIIALAAKVGVISALGMTSVLFLTLAVAVGLVAGRKPPAVIAAPTPPIGDIAFLLGFLAIRALLRRK